MHGANKVRAISARTGANWVDGAHHNADDIVEGPKPGAETTRLHFVYDAWNRLRKVYEDDGDGQFDPDTEDDLLAAYEHLCPCQLAVLDRFMVLPCSGTEERVGGAGGGDSSPCSPGVAGPEWPCAARWMFRPSLLRKTFWLAVLRKMFGPCAARSAGWQFGNRSRVPEPFSRSGMRGTIINPKFLPGFCPKPLSAHGLGVFGAALCSHVIRDIAP